MKVYNVSSMNESLERVRTKFDELFKSTLTMRSTDERNVLNTQLQVVSDYRFAIDIDRTIHDLVVIHALKAEAASPGSFRECIELTIDELSSINWGNQDSTVDDSSRDNVELLTTAPRVSDIDWIISIFCDRSMIDLVRSILDMTGFSGRASIERSSANIDIVEQFDGHSFDFNVAFNVKKTILTSPKVLLIDGYVESVSEIHHFLTLANDTKETILMFSRGMSNDVVHTLKTNFDRKTLNVIPILVDFDFDGINSLADLSVI